MQMVRYNPFHVGELQNEINRLFSNWGDTESSSATAGWVPAVDIQEFDTRFRLFVDVPGVDPDAVEITLDSGVLTISGERVMPDSPESDQVVERCLERRHGRFYRRFVLPDTVDADKVKAKDRHGVLEISIPKQAKALPRRIKVAA
jgi:HSP20 family protein